jgi:integrase
MKQLKRLFAAIADFVAHLRQFKPKPPEATKPEFDDFSSSQKFKRKHLKAEEAAHLLRCADETSARDAALIRLLLTTGLRTVEVARARWEHIATVEVNDRPGAREAVALFVRGKGRTEYDRFVILTEDTLRALERHRRTQKATPHLFAGYKNKPLTERAMRDIVARQLECAGIEGFSAHSLRHTFAMLALKAGYTQSDVQRALRHASAASTEIYTQPALVEQAAAARISEAVEAILNVSTPVATVKAEYRRSRDVEPLQNVQQLAPPSPSPAPSSPPPAPATPAVPVSLAGEKEEEPDDVDDDCTCRGEASCIEDVGGWMWDRCAQGFTRDQFPPWLEVAQDINYLNAEQMARLVYDYVNAGERGMMYYTTIQKEHIDEGKRWKRQQDEMIAQAELLRAKKNPRRP